MFAKSLLLSLFLSLATLLAGTAQADGPSTSFKVYGDVINAGIYDLADLEGLGMSTSTTVGTDTYTGVDLWDFLNLVVGLETDPAVKNDALGMYVVATGTDGYKAIISLGEIHDSFGAQPDMIAFMLNDEYLTDSGFAKLVVPNDVKKGRWVSNLESLGVYHAALPVPEPQVYATMLIGLGLVGVIVRRRKMGNNQD